MTVAASIAGCSGTSANVALGQNAECSVRVIVRFATDPDGPLLADVERRNAVELDLVQAITNDLRVFILRAADADGCAAAMDRLRHDERVRSVDVDERREIHEEPRVDGNA